MVRGELVDEWLVEPGERAERSRDEMQFVLDDKVRRRSAARAVRADAEESSCSWLPRQHRELVDGANHERRRIAVDVLVDHVDREAARELAGPIWAAQHDG